MKYRVSIDVTAYMRVEADSEDEAVAVAEAMHSTEIEDFIRSTGGIEIRADVVEACDGLDVLYRV